MSSEAQFFLDKDDFHPAFFALVSRDDIIAADPAFAAAACGHISAGFDRDTFAGLSAGGAAVQPVGIGGSSAALHTKESFVYIADDLIVSDDKDDHFGAEADGGDTVGIAVYVIDLAVFGDCIG